MGLVLTKVKTIWNNLRNKIAILNHNPRFKIIFPLVGIFFLMIGMLVALELIKHPQDINKRASENPLNSSDKDYSILVPLNIKKPIYKFSITGLANLSNNYSFVRAILVDKNNNEYLVYETYYAIADSLSFSVNDTCDETCVLDAVVPDHLRIEGNSATFDIKNNSISDKNPTQGVTAQSDLPAKIAALKIEKDNLKIGQIKSLNMKREINWSAGSTSISKLTYSQKKKLFPNPDGTPRETLPNLQGFEYYKSGVFEYHSALSSTPASASDVITAANTGFPEAWDWRDRHGANWVTPVKNQGHCGSCGVFAPIAAVEADLNLYSNRHLDLDLSEQDVLSCGQIGTCTTGVWPRDVLFYVEKPGVVTEACLTYKAKDLACNNLKCKNWTKHLVKITGSEEGKQTVRWLKTNLITKGVLSAGVLDWTHAMALVGWDHNNNWIFKNSWGIDWGEEGGFVRMKLTPAEMGWIASIIYPITTTEVRRSPVVNCVDSDKDGYCNWGISETKPSTCPKSCKKQKDCDDSNPQLGPFDANYNCTHISSSPTPITSPTPSPISTPTPVPGNIIFQDDFSTDKSWKPFIYGAGKAYLTNNTYHLKQTKAINAIYSLAPPVNLANYQMYFDVKLTGNSPNDGVGLGFVFETNCNKCTMAKFSTSSLYRFSISPQFGTWKLQRFTSSDTTLLGFGTIDELRKADNPNIPLKLKLERNTKSGGIKIYYSTGSDWHLVSSTTNSSLKNGGVGLFVFGSYQTSINKPAEAEFDNFVVRDLGSNYTSSANTPVAAESANPLTCTSDKNCPTGYHCNLTPCPSSCTSAVMVEQITTECDSCSQEINTCLPTL